MPGTMEEMLKLPGVGRKNGQLCARRGLWSPRGGRGYARKKAGSPTGAHGKPEPGQDRRGRGVPPSEGDVASIFRHPDLPRTRRLQGEKTRSQGLCGPPDLPFPRHMIPPRGMGPLAQPKAHGLRPDRRFHPKCMVPQKRLRVFPPLRALRGFKKHPFHHEGHEEHEGGRR